MATRLNTIIICTYNRAPYLDLCLAAIARQTLPSNRYRLMVVDNNSSDDTQQVVQRHQANGLPVEYFFEDRQGLSYARNRGLAESDTKYLLFLDDDAILSDDSLANLQTYLEGNPDVTIVGGRAIIHYTNGKPDWVTPKVEAWMGSYDYGTQEIAVNESTIKNKEVRLPIGCCFIVTRSLLEELGGFKPSLGRVGKKMLAGEETLIGLKALEQGGKIVYLPSVYVDHMIEPHWVDREFLANKTYFYGISDINVQFLSGKSLSKIMQYLVFRFLFLGKNVLDLTLCALKNSPQRAYEISLLFNFNRGVYAGLFHRLRAS